MVFSSLSPPASACFISLSNELDKRDREKNSFKQILGSMKHVAANQIYISHDQYA